MPIVNLQRYLFNIKEELSELTVNGLADEAIEVPLEQKSSKEIRFALADSSILKGLPTNSKFTFLPASVKVTGPSSVIDTMPRVMRLQPGIEQISAGYAEKINLPQLKKQHCEYSSRSVILSFEAVKNDSAALPPSP